MGTNLHFRAMMDYLMTMVEFDTADRQWDARWRSVAGRADWLDVDAGVAQAARHLRERGFARALDLGCGVGRHAIHLAELGFCTFALDGSDGGIAFARAEAADRGLDIDFRVGRMTALPYDTDSFDYVLSFDVIYHGDRQIVERAIAEIRRVLRVGGVYQGTMLSKRNACFDLGEEVAPDTFVRSGADDDKAHPHFYCDAAGLVGLFGGFELLELRDVEQALAHAGGALRQIEPREATPVVPLRRSGPSLCRRRRSPPMPYRPA